VDRVRMAAKESIGEGYPKSRGVEHPLEDVLMQVRGAMNDFNGASGNGWSVTPFDTSGTWDPLQPKSTGDSGGVGAGGRRG